MERECASTRETLSEVLSDLMSQCRHSGGRSRASQQPPGTYWGPPSQGSMLVTDTLCPRHIRTPAWHSVIVRLAPSTSTQTVLPSSWHSEASLHSHALPWAGKEGRRAHGHIVAMASRGVPSLWWLATHGSSCSQQWNPPPPGIGPGKPGRLLRSALAGLETGAKLAVTIWCTWGNSPKARAVQLCPSPGGRAGKSEPE